MSKISAAAGLLVVASALTGAAREPARVSVVVGIVAAASMLLGNVMALRQDDATRLLAWSTVAQAGWVVLPVAAVSTGGLRASAAYVLVYALATMVAFAAVARVGTGPLARFRGLLRRDRLTGGALASPSWSSRGSPRGHRARRESGRAGPGRRRRPVATRRRRGRRRRAGRRRLPPVVRAAARRAGASRPGRVAVAAGSRAVLVLGTALLVLLSALPALLLDLLS